MKAFRLVLVFVLVVALFSVVAAQDDDYKVLRGRLGSTDVPYLDPALATDSSSIQILMETYVGLTVLADETLATEPGLATSWDIVENDDGTVTYTFHLLEGVPWVRYDMDAGEVVQVMDEMGNPRMVTAHDVVYGFKRTINPDTTAEYAYVLYPQVVGGTELAEAEEVTEELINGLAVKAIDDYTLEVVAPQFLGFQPAIYGMWMARPQPQWAIEEFGDFWQEPENYQSYGPYVVSEWAHDESITMILNPYWPGTETVPAGEIDEIQLFFLDASVALSQYEAGELDYLDTVPSTDIDRLKADDVLSDQFTITESTGTYYYGFNTRDEPTNNVNLRRAMSFAIDRESLIDNVVKGGQVPAQWFATPSLAAAPTLDTHPDLGVWYDPDMARDFLATALEELGYASVDELPTLTLLFNTNENHARYAEAIQQMWADELGIEVQLTNQEFAVYLDSRENFPVWRAGWGADYPDAHNFLFDVYHSSSQNNDTWWTSEAYDALLEEAMTLTDIEARRALYAQAENILVYEDAAIIPIYWSTKLNMTAPYVERTYSLETQERFHKWDMSD